MTEDSANWLHKVQIKKLIGIDEPRLIKLVLSQILIPHRHHKGEYLRMPIRLSRIVDRQEPGEWLGSVYKPPSLKRHTEWVDITPQQIKNLLSGEYVWFERWEFEDAQLEGKIKLPSEKPICSSDTGKKIDALSSLDDMKKYVSGRLAQGVDKRSIGLELKKSKNKLCSLYHIGRALNLDEGLIDDDKGVVARLKQRTTRYLNPPKKKSNK